MSNLATDLARVMELVTDLRAAASLGRPLTHSEVDELERAITAWSTRAASGGDSASLEKRSDGMLPDELVPYSKEWYRFCERRFAVERMTISGELAEAIVACISRLNEPFGNPEQLASLEQQALSDEFIDAALFDSMDDESAMLIDYMGMGHADKLELARAVLRSAITAALANQQGVGAGTDEANRLLREVVDNLEGVGCGPCIGSHTPFEDLHGRIERYLAAQPAGDVGREGA